MVPDSYHTFFSATAEIAGTLIGLLFVASSLSPEKLGGADFDFQVRAGVAYAALSNALVVGLIALMPGENLGIPGIVLAAGGLSSAAAIGTVSFRHARLHRRLRSLSRVIALAALFGVQLGYSIDLRVHPHATGSVQTLAFVLVFSFLFAIERAWELLGGDGSGVFSLLAKAVARRTRSSSAPPREEP